jgi:hypothetical protein
MAECIHTYFLLLRPSRPPDLYQCSPSPPICLRNRDARACYTVKDVY